MGPRSIKSSGSIKMRSSGTVFAKLVCDSR
jgi:hypothetical protein